MVYNPVKVKGDVPQIQSWRLDDKTKSIHKSRFITHGFTTQKERIKEALERNKFLQTEPILLAASLHNFRPNDAYKSDYMHKISKQLSSEKKKQSFALSETRNSMPELPQKTHFKAVVSLAMQVGCLKKQNSIKMKDIDYEDAISRVREANRLNSPMAKYQDAIKDIDKKKMTKSMTSKIKLDSEQCPEKLAEYILVACNVISQKNRKSSKLMATKSENFSQLSKGDSKCNQNCNENNNCDNIDIEEITEQDYGEESQKDVNVL